MKFIHLTHPSWIKVLISLKKEEKITDPKLLDSIVYCNTIIIIIIIIFFKCCSF